MVQNIKYSCGLNENVPTASMRPNALSPDGRVILRIGRNYKKQTQEKEAGHWSGAPTSINL